MNPQLMSERTADVLFGALPAMESGDLAGFSRHLDHALEGGSLTEWALHALLTYPSVPDMPALEFSLPMPDWESV